MQERSDSSNSDRFEESRREKEKRGRNSREPLSSKQAMSLIERGNLHS